VIGRAPAAFGLSVSTHVSRCAEATEPNTRIFGVGVKSHRSPLSRPVVLDTWARDHKAPDGGRAALWRPCKGSLAR